MPDAPQVGTEFQLNLLIDRLRCGDASAREEMLLHACERLRRLTRKMFHAYPSLRRWEETDDVFQNAMLRLHRALGSLEIGSIRHFFNLAAQQVRWELLDLAKHHFGPACAGAHHHTDGIHSEDKGARLLARSEEPEDLADWTEFHAQVELLPEDEREVVNLLYYEGLGQSEVAELLGVSVRTVKRRWQSARFHLYEAVHRDGEGTRRG